jgi:hypothetical protein
VDSHFSGERILAAARRRCYYECSAVMCKDLGVSPLTYSDMKAANSDIYALRGGQPYGARGISIEQLMTLP